MSLFRFVKYSSLLFLLGKYKHKVFRVVAVLLLAAVTALLGGGLAMIGLGLIVWALYPISDQEAAESTDEAEHLANADVVPA